MAKLKVDQVLRRATSHLRKGETDEARALYQSVLEVFPKNARARQGLAQLDRPAAPSGAAVHPTQAQMNALLELRNAGRHGDMVEQAKALTQKFPKSFLLHNIIGVGYRGLGQLEQAEVAFRQAVACNPEASDVYKNLGMTLINLGKFEAAVEAYQTLTQLKPDEATAYNNMGLALRELEQFDAALNAFNRALKIQPTFAEALSNKGLTLYQQDETEAALAEYQRAIALNPDYPAAHYNRGNALRQKGQTAEAIAAYRRAINLRPDYADALNNLGAILTIEGKYKDALVVLRKAVTLQPDNPVVHNNLGNVWLEQNAFAKAQDMYQRALALRPDYARALSNLGITLHEQGKFDDARDAFAKATTLEPTFVEAHINMGNTLTKTGMLEEAIAAYARAVQLHPSSAEAESAMLHQMQHACDWSAYDHLPAATSRLGLEADTVPPFATLSMEDHPGRQRQRSQKWIRAHASRLAIEAPVRSFDPKDQLHIGYFSADFHNHPCLYLLMGLLRCHDRERFKISVFSYGQKKDGELREQAKEIVSHFHDVANMADAELVTFAHAQNLDVAIDLMGHTRGSKFTLFEHRLAPVQVSFVGYPGTTGAEYMDYLVGDPTVIPPEHRQAYTESILYMPHTYLPNDNTLPISEKVTTRADHNLPQDAFVLCCFNNNYKISPREFDIWMRVLREVDDAVLWMLKSNRYSEANLRKEAQTRGVDPARLVVGEKILHPEHMARHRHADLFLDTFNYNAHTTASEALWAGLPIVTKRGEQFAARVAASMLTSIGLPELITTTEAEYEALILALARDRARLGQLKEKLAANRLHAPFFDNAKFAADFENGLTQTIELYRNGAAPQDIQCGDKLP